MEIGTQLKNTRLLLGLTQDQFSAGIVSESYYSRVENNKSNIDMDSLLKILNYNQVSLHDFFEPVLKEDVDEELIRAFLNHDINKIKELDLANSNTQMIAKVMLAILNKKISNSKKYSLQLENYLSETNERQNKYVIYLLLAYLCDLKQLKKIMDEITEEVSNKDELTLRIIVRTELVIIERFYNAGKERTARRFIELINALPNNSNIILEKTIARYYLALINKKKEEANEISKTLKITGYSKYVLDMN
ncbi:helix-turn-helix domain-containing protein [Lactobacillus gasseri]|uniref:helix-turn-helix domain-containing protein n=1 Tax=Lactobacillus gasseri TaxID=1596 RepID=UPI001196AFA6|nr:helix-turn-helix transcriptional regulator [Lactobacillus gasseri]TVU92741.1 helix-turn-helix transcriptional regulator [Lactobacillus gasseri]TVV16476.1 helix-turn-helix transcriptional regulator [Lactobacillus gasseri]